MWGVLLFLETDLGYAIRVVQPEGCEELDFYKFIFWTWLVAIRQRNCHSFRLIARQQYPYLGTEPREQL